MGKSKQHAANFFNFDALDKEIDNLFNICLRCKTLEKVNSNFHSLLTSNLSEELQQAKLERRLEKEQKFERLYEQERKKLESDKDKKNEEELEEAIHDLQIQLFDITVDNQQTRLFMDRICMHRQLKSLLGKKNGFKDLLKERDDLVKVIFKLQNECTETKANLVQLQKKCSDISEENRQLYAESKRKMPGKTIEKDDLPRDDIDSDWVRQVFSTLVIESKLNFAKDPTLAKMFLM